MVQSFLAMVGVLSTQWAQEVSAHGKLTVPRSRNEIDGNAGCAHCLNTGGPCGDGNSGKFLDEFFGSEATWTAGSIVPIEIEITAHHRGHYEFRICDQVLNSGVADPDSCLNQWVLERATAAEAGFDDCQPGDQRAFCTPFDPNHPERFYLPPESEVALTHTIYFKVPAGLQCEVCTLQWHWWSANSCVPAGDYGCYKDILQANGYWVENKSAWWSNFGGPGEDCTGPAGPNGHFGCGEQFWNCADITVLAAGSPSETTATTTSEASATETSTSQFSESTTTTTTTQSAVETSTTSQGMVTCVAAAGAENFFETTDQRCEDACQALPAGQWPCGFGHPCECSGLSATTASTTSATVAQSTAQTTTDSVTTTVQTSNSVTSTGQAETTTTAALTHCVPNEDLPITVGKPTAEACLACPEQQWDPCLGRTVNGQFYDLCICPESLVQAQLASKKKASMASEVRRHNFLASGTQKDQGSVFIQSGALASKVSEAGSDEL